VVARCGSQPKSCHPGFCVEGYCVRPEAHGQRDCSHISGAVSDPAERAGCQCYPQSGARARDGDVCGSFPCGPNGCYVQKCERDEDCKIGLCSAYASGPHGYCVTDDDK
jgi:hypothetical protein